MLHMFFRLMELECSLIAPKNLHLATIRRLAPDVLILDFDLPDLRALDLARELRRSDPAFPIIFLSEDETVEPPVDAPVMRKPTDRFEELLRLFELVLEVER